jgi:hypothetical protein
LELLEPPQSSSQEGFHPRAVRVAVTVIVWTKITKRETIGTKENRFILMDDAMDDSGNSEGTFFVLGLIGLFMN